MARAKTDNTHEPKEGKGGTATGSKSGHRAKRYCFILDCLGDYPQLDQEMIQKAWREE